MHYLYTFALHTVDHIFKWLNRRPSTDRKDREDVAILVLVRMPSLSDCLSTLTSAVCHGCRAH